MASAALIGCTGLVGSHILSTALASPAIARINIFSRRRPQIEDIATEDKLIPFMSGDASEWTTQIGELSTPPSLFFSSFATTRASAGGFENQYQIEHGLHLELARAAKRAGSGVFILVSSSHANHESRIPYARMKGEIEENIKELDFEKTIVLRPGMIIGDRQERRPAEAAARYVVETIGRLNPTWRDRLAQDADVIARAAVNAGLQAIQDSGHAGNEKVWVLSGSEIIQA